MSIRSSDISRWPLPPSRTPQDKVRMCLPHKQIYPVMKIHNDFLLCALKKYNFDSIDEVLRHLIYTANSEPSPIKKLIFKTIRCLHCHVGARADQHIKINLGTIKSNASEAAASEEKEEEKEASEEEEEDPTIEPINIAIHTFHYEWLSKVTESCNIASIEKCVRIIIDYYQSRVKQVFHSDGLEASMKKELLLFGKNRMDDPRFQEVLATLKEQDEKVDKDKDTDEDAHDDTPDDNDAPHVHDPAACTKDEITKAIQRCQVGRNSKSYSIALKETSKEYEERRSKEILIENSDESKAARIKIGKALGSPMG
jgi:hypothetical protein